MGSVNKHYNYVNSTQLLGAGSPSEIAGRGVCYSAIEGSCLAKLCNEFRFTLYSNIFIENHIVWPSKVIP